MTAASPVEHVAVLAKLIEDEAAFEILISPLAKIVVGSAGFECYDLALFHASILVGKFAVVSQQPEGS
jgi:hypothetical protein